MKEKWEKVVTGFRYALLMRFIPSGWATVGAGWLGIINSLRCVAGYVIPGVECPVNPGEAIVSALTGIGFVGIGRRGQK